MSDSLAILLRALHAAGLDIDAEAALDGLWLGSQMVAVEKSREVPRPTPTSIDVVSPRPGEERTSDGGTRRSSGTTRRDSLAIRAVDLTTAETATESIADTAAAPQARSLTLERAAALPASRDLIKALRPLRRRVLSPGDGSLDIDATVRRAADEDLWFPTFEPARERWLDVLLVADHGLSMILWKDTIDEFERVLKSSGAFRSVRSWWLESDAEEIAITARGRGASPRRPAHLARMTRGAGRSVILVISDCVGARWSDGSIPRVVSTWSQTLPVALVQVTPEWFWSRTALRDAVASRFRSTTPGAVNQRFRWETDPLGGIGSDDLLRIPAMTLTADAIARVSSLIAGVGREWAPGVVFDLTWEGEDAVGVEPAITAKERVTRFRTLASNAAQRLAAGFAASPVRTLDVLRLLRRDLLPDATPFTEAEVVLGGILRVKRDEAKWELGTQLPLEFVPGVQNLLLDGAIAGDVLRVLKHAAAVAESGVGKTFTSWLENPSSSAGRLDPSENAFAASAAEVLNRLGGSYARLVKPAEPSPTPHASSESQQRSFLRRSVVGAPHSLRLPTKFFGRDGELEQLRAWLERGSPAVQLLTGVAGIGKTALAAVAIDEWQSQWPDQSPFVWRFSEESGVAALLDAFRPREHRLIVFDGIEQIGNDARLSDWIDVVALMSRVDGARILLTSRDRNPLGIEVNEVSVVGLDREAAVELALASAPTLASSTNAELGQLSELLALLTGGNPVVIGALARHIDALSIGVLHEELPDTRAPDPFSVDKLSELDATMSQIGRARQQMERARSLIAEGRASDAVFALTDVVQLRSSLPSMRLRGEALAERGSAYLVVQNFERAAADLADAVGIFKTLSRPRELLGALIGLADTRSATGRDEEALALLSEARHTAREVNDSGLLARVLLRLGQVMARTGSPDEAAATLRESAEVALSAGDPFTLGEANMTAATVYDRLKDRESALRSAHEAVRAFRQTNSTAHLAAALAVLIRLALDRGDFPSARSFLEELRHIDQDGAGRIGLQIDTAERAAQSGAIPDDDGVYEVEFLITGRVSGVGFRLFAQTAARELDIGEATAENLRDGRVRVVAKSRGRLLRQLEARLRHGPPMAKIEDIAITILERPTPAQTAPPSVARQRDVSNARAVIAIGVGRPSDHVPPLQWPMDRARDVAEWARQSQQIPSENVFVFTDDREPVNRRRFSRALDDVVAAERFSQLIVYFAGYARTVRESDHWLLSETSEDPAPSISLDALTEAARTSGIPHVVFIGDTQPGIRSQTEFVPPEPLLPDRSTKRLGAVDVFLGPRISGFSPPRGDGFDGLYTTLLLSALSGNERALLDRGGGTFIRPRLLRDHLAHVMPQELARFHVAQIGVQLPTARIESGDDAWLARIDRAVLA